MKKNMDVGTPLKKISFQKKGPAREKDRQDQLTITLPHQFLLLCKLMDIPPMKLVTDFMDNLSCGSWNREGRDAAKQKLIDYFIEQGYGQEFYTPADTRAIFKEMDAIGLLWPENGQIELIELTEKWRDQFQSYWFEKWFRKPRRKPG